MGAVTIPAWLAIVLAGVITGLIGLVWRDLVKRIDIISSKLDGHVAEDNAAHGRITVIEATMQMHTQGVKDNADRLHRFMAETREVATKLHMWITEKVIDSIKRP
jgi:hypothetical protein